MITIQIDAQFSSSLSRYNTAREYLERIMREGLTKGDVPMSNSGKYKAEGVNAV